jgi:sugar lactone lactonase YvrE
MGFADGPAKTAAFANPMGLAVDGKGNIYVADSRNNLIRMISCDGLVSTVAGNRASGGADGKGPAASFFDPAGITIDKKGNLYIADTQNSLIRKIGINGTVTTVSAIRAPSAAKGYETARQFDHPQGIAIDSFNNIYIADWANDVIKKMDTTGRIAILAGRPGSPGAKDGHGTSASFYLPEGIAVDGSQNLYVCDTYNNLIRKISPDGYVTTVAGKKAKGATDGKGSAASFSHPSGITVDRYGNLYVSDAGNNKIRKIAPDGMVTTLAGNGHRGAEDGSDTLASFYRPYGIAIAGDGSLLIADYQNNVIRKISF